MNLPLSGIRILDLTAALAGPAATQRLAEWGADVIKVEPPMGEMTRNYPVMNGYLAGETTVFLSLNRSKRSISLDLKTEEGRESLLELVDDADVFVHNYRPGVVGRLGLTGPELMARNGRLVYASVSGYGESGPDSRRPGQDLLLQAYAGTLFSSGSADDPPSPGPIFVADVLTSHHLAQGILVALIDRGRTGRGQMVSTTMLGAMLDAQAQELVTFLNLGIEPRRGRERRAHAFLNPPYSIFETADGWLAIAMADPLVLGDVLGSRLISDIGTWEGAAERADDVIGEVRRIMPTRTTSEWLPLLDAVNVWCGPVHTYAQLRELEQLRAADLLLEVPRPDGSGCFTAPANPVRLSAHPNLQVGAPPRLGGSDVVANGSLPVNWEGSEWQPE